MFKNAIKTILSFVALVGAYQGYLLGFAALTERLVEGHGPAPFVMSEARWKKMATALARESLGESHWAAHGPKIQLYDAERGFFMYAGEYDRKEKGKVFDFYPFLIIWISKDGRTRKIATSNRARIELNEPLGMLKPGTSPTHVVEATLEEEVVLRDDKGTATDPSDDMVVGPLPYITYTEKTTPAQISSVSDVRIADPNVTITGHELLILMRKAPEGGDGAPAGFDAEIAKLMRDVRIDVKDVGKSGGLPGQSAAKPGKAGGPVPLTVRNDHEMQVDLPPKVKPLGKGEVGPPELEAPTYVTFQTNVEVARGRDEPDLLNSDSLKLTLLPAEPKVEFVAHPAGGAVVLGLAAFAPGAGGIGPKSARGDSDGPIGNLDIRELVAKGHAVWLRSPSQGSTARCNELIYKKRLPYAANETYLRADAPNRLFVEKIDRLPTGAIKEVATVRGVDATLFDDGKGSAASNVVVRGPGKYESRPDRDKSVLHSASWTDQMIMATLPAAPGSYPPLAAGEAPPTRRRVTLLGDPVLTDHAKEMRLEAKTSVIGLFRPTARSKPGEPKPAAAPTGSSPLTSGSTRLEWVEAREKVRLTTPDKTVIARDSLDAPFEELAAAVAAAPAPAPAPVVAAPVVAAVVAPVPVEPDNRKAAPAPAALVRANSVWVKIGQRPDGKAEILQARLRRGVTVDQDPAPDKPRGTHITGEALDLQSLGNGLMKFKVCKDDPEARAGDARLAARGDGRIVQSPDAAVDTEDYSIRGPLIGLDQSIDFAWVRGPGSMTQLSERGFLTDQAIKDQYKARAAMTPEQRKAEKAKKELMTISWSEQMQFNGRGVDPKGRPSGKAEFRGKVVAKTRDEGIVADEIDTYTDGPVRLVPTKRDKPLGLVDNRDASVSPASAEASGDAPASPAPKVELSRLEARSRTPWTPAIVGVLVDSYRRDEQTGEPCERKLLQSSNVYYDRETGDYSAPGAGIARFWRLKDPASGRPQPRLIADNSAAPKPKAKPGKAVWELTKIKYADLMNGRFGVSKEETTARTADFYGDVQALNGPVAGPADDLDFDRWTRGSKFITSDSLRVVDIPPPSGSKGIPSDQLMTAEGGNPVARDDTHLISGDVLTFDSKKGLFLARGENGHFAEVVSQSGPGQPATRVPGTAVLYNQKLGTSQVVDPMNFSFVDGKGIRPSIEFAPSKPGDPPKTRRPGLRPPARTHLERRDFTGR